MTNNIAIYNGWLLFNPAVLCNRVIRVLYMNQCVPTFVLSKLFTDFNLQLPSQILMDATCCKLLFLNRLSFYVFQTVPNQFYILSAMCVFVTTYRLHLPASVWPRSTWPFWALTTLLLVRYSDLNVRCCINLLKVVENNYNWQVHKIYSISLVNRKCLFPL